MSDFRVPHLNVRKISPNHLNDFEKEVTDIHYDPVTPVHHTFKKIEDPLDYEDMENFPYLHPQAISKAYNNLNKPVKL